LRSGERLRFFLAAGEEHCCGRKCVYQSAGYVIFRAASRNTLIAHKYHQWKDSIGENLVAEIFFNFDIFSVERRECLRKLDRHRIREVRATLRLAVFGNLGAIQQFKSLAEHGIAL